MIRRATPTDGSRLARLQSLLPRQSPDLLDYGLVVGDVLVATVDGDVVGYVLPVPGDGVHVAELVVDDDHRREGHATALLDAVTDGLAAGEEVTLAVEPDNEGAQAFYRAIGFEERERRPDYFGGAPALWFVKTV
ncbi:Acetyltransferase (GNAT) family protein [Halogranum gelatinilyticum]|uniref:Acetyltransferase (GNAT) family protein n=1 Tax=Halogranum gelatinilyticum TaxID=660521 RepID=A0A1G9TV38_9EURY|nr:N-acetyltransferase [Halogranum gelatinilyticum]SDM51451.1 Acetyltransferase (GNAT) family protein [Halogranum gelatinilyticum]